MSRRFGSDRDGLERIAYMLNLKGWGLALVLSIALFLASAVVPKLVRGDALAFRVGKVPALAGRASYGEAIGTGSGLDAERNPRSHLGPEPFRRRVRR